MSCPHRPTSSSSPLLSHRRRLTPRRPLPLTHSRVRPQPPVPLVVPPRLTIPVVTHLEIVCPALYSHATLTRRRPSLILSPRHPSLILSPRRGRRQ